MAAVYVSPTFSFSFAGECFAARYEVEKDLVVGSALYSGFTVLQVDLDEKGTPWNSTPCITLPSLPQCRGYLDKKLAPAA